jgi:hypothetical protein
MKKTILAFLMAGLMIAIVFTGLSVSATDGGQQQAEPVGGGEPTPILGNVRIYVYELVRTGLFRWEEEPIRNALVNISTYFPDPINYPFVIGGFTGRDGLTRWFSLIPFVYVVSVVKLGYYTKLIQPLVVFPGDEKTISVRLTLKSDGSSDSDHLLEGPNGPVYE